MSALDPASEPAQITEGILPLWMNRGSFYVFGSQWAKYRVAHPWGTFEEWWKHQECVYDLNNAKAKHFWDEFSRDKEKQAKILADRALQRKIKRILETNRPYALAAGLLEPKPETVDEVADAGNFAYRFRGDTLSEED